jgi:hypothetical protein
MLNTTEALLEFHSRLILSIHGIAEEELLRPEAEGAWSIVDVILHLSHVELLAAVRIRLMLAEEEPQLPRLSQNEWMGRLRGRQPLAEVLEQFWFLRRQNVSLLCSLSAEELQRAGVHPTLGRLTVAQLVEVVSEHAEKHLRQIERIKGAHRLEVSSSSSLAGVTASVAGTREHRSPGPGVRVYDLWSNGVRRALQLELDPGARWPGLDYHVPGPEEVFVVSGDFDDGEHRYEAGTFLHHPAGSSHSPTSATGCVLFVYYPEG